MDQNQPQKPPSTTTTPFKKPSIPVPTKIPSGIPTPSSAIPTATGIPSGN